MTCASSSRLKPKRGGRSISKVTKGRGTVVTVAITSASRERLPNCRRAASVPSAIGRFGGGILKQGWTRTHFILHRWVSPLAGEGRSTHGPRSRWHQPRKQATTSGDTEGMAPKRKRGRKRRLDCFPVQEFRRPDHGKSFFGSSGTIERRCKAALEMDHPGRGPKSPLASRRSADYSPQIGY